MTLGARSFTPSGHFRDGDVTDESDRSTLFAIALFLRQSNTQMSAVVFTVSNSIKNLSEIQYYKISISIICLMKLVKRL